MAVLLVTHHVSERYGERIRAAAAESGLALEFVVLPPGMEARLSAEELASVDIAFFSGDLMDNNTRGFFAAAQGAPNLKWMHCFNAGVDNPVFTRIREKGVRLTTSSGSTAVPIAQTLITGMLMLARRMPHYAEAQRRHEWSRVPASQVPADLSTETLAVFGMGAIGSEIARLGQALGMHVIGVRRSPMRSGDPADEVVPPSKLTEVLPRTQWLALASPLTEETRQIINGAAIRSMPRSSYILNISRGEVVDEAAMIEALRDGHLAGAYLDVFETEPLQPESPLWDLPNVIVTPHNSSISTGNEERVFAFFLTNLRAWTKGEAMTNEV